MPSCCAVLIVWTTGWPCAQTSLIGGQGRGGRTAAGRQQWQGVGIWLQCWCNGFNLSPSFRLKRVCELGGNDGIEHEPACMSMVAKWATYLIQFQLINQHLVRVALWLLEKATSASRQTKLSKHVHCTLSLSSSIITGGLLVRVTQRDHDWFIQTTNHLYHHVPQYQRTNRSENLRI